MLTAEEAEELREIAADYRQRDKRLTAQWLEDLAAKYQPSNPEIPEN